MNSAFALSSFLLSFSAYHRSSVRLQAAAVTAVSSNERSASPVGRERRGRERERESGSTGKTCEQVGLPAGPVGAPPLLPLSLSRHGLAHRRHSLWPAAAAPQGRRRQAESRRGRRRRRRWRGRWARPPRASEAVKACTCCTVRIAIAKLKCESRPSRPPSRRA